MCDITLEKKPQVRSGYMDIMLNGEIPIGYIDESGNTLVKIEIEKPFREKGYGKKAVKAWVERNENNYRKLETTAVIDDRMTRIMESLGFSMIKGTGRFVYST